MAANQNGVSAVHILISIGIACLLLAPLAAWATAPGSPRLRALAAVLVGVVMLAAANLAALQQLGPNPPH